jgi:hypothetical protein
MLKKELESDGKGVDTVRRGEKKAFQGSRVVWSNTNDLPHWVQ